MPTKDTTENSPGGTVPIELAGPGQYRGEGWLPGQSVPVYSRPDGWTWFVGKQAWFYTPFIRDGGPTFDEWTAQGSPVHGAPPVGPPLVYPAEPSGEATGGMGTPLLAPDQGNSASGLTRCEDGRYLGQGWFEDEDPPVYLRSDGWVWFSQYAHWQYVPFVHATGPTQAEWEAAGKPLYGTPPADPPPGYASAGERRAGSAAPAALLGDVIVSGVLVAPNNDHAGRRT